MSDRELKAAVVGGSLGGLMAAIALQGAGVSVEVFERLPQRLQAQGAGLRIVPEMAALLQERAGIDLTAVSTVTRWFRHIGPANRMVSNQEIRGQFTSWGSLHRALSAAFGAGRYHLGKACTGIAQSPDFVQLRFGDASETADLAVFADGILSTGRRLLAPDTSLRYAGYVTWRGFVPASALRDETRAILAEAVTYSVMDHSHMIIYPIPDPSGADPNAILFNFVWYRNVAEGAALDALMTDRDGVRRPISLPAGSVQDEFVDGIRAAAAELLPPASAEVIARTREPFIQALYDVMTPRMVDGRCCLVGDAAFATRPHAGAATTKAAVDAWRLADRLAESGGDVLAALALWEPEQRDLGNAFVARNRQMGSRSMVANTFNPADATSQPGLHGPG